MKSFAENTMNELLGWYGYDKVELRDGENVEGGDHPQHVSVLKENSLTKVPVSMETSEASPERAPDPRSAPASRNGVPETSSTATASTSAPPMAKEHPGLPMMVPMIPPPHIKPPPDEDPSTVQIVCAWCQKVGVRRYSLSMASELKSFCSEKCFAACRRAYFKRNKARDDGGHGGKLPQHSFAQDPPRLVYKTNSDVLVCDWCKHIRHTKEYLDFGAGERRLQFCSAKCLNQYKMDIFYKETQAALPGALYNPGHVASCEGKAECSGGGGGGGVQLLTPESWGAPMTDLRRKAPSPGPATSSALAPSTSSNNSPPDPGGLCSPSSSSTSAKVPTPRPHENPPHQLPPHHGPGLHGPMGVSSGSPPMVMTPRGPVPLPLFMEHQMMQQIRPPFLRPSAGPNSPLSNPMIPGIGPPQPPPRTFGGPASSPMHRPMLSPHVHPSANHNPGLLPPHPGLGMPGMPPFPPVNMMPNGPMPMPPMMNFGMPSLAPLVPPPTILVPYPVIVPLPVPIPIPIPIPYSGKFYRDKPDGSGGPVPCASESSEASDSRPHSRGSFGGDRVEQKVGKPASLALSPGYSPGQLNNGSDRGRATVVDLTVKTEDGPRNLCLASGAGSMDGVIDLTVGHRSGQQPVRQKTLPGVQVKVERVEFDVKAPHVAGQGRDGGDLIDGRARTLLQGPVVAAAKEQANDATVSKTLASSCLPCSPAPVTATAQPCDPTIPSFPGRLASPGREPQTVPQPLSQGLATPHNVIMNGTGWHTPSLPASESCADRVKDGAVAGEGVGAGGLGEGGEVQPANGELEREALKENSCSVAVWEPGMRCLAEDAVAVMGEGKPDSGLGEGENPYALPLLPPSGCVVIQPMPKADTDKTAILSCSISTPLLSATGSPECEPPLKRRCLFERGRRLLGKRDLSMLMSRGRRNFKLQSRCMCVSA